MSRRPVARPAKLRLRRSTPAQCQLVVPAVETAGHLRDDRAAGGPAGDPAGEMERPRYPSSQRSPASLPRRRGSALPPRPIPGRGGIRHRSGLEGPDAGFDDRRMGMTQDRGAHGQGMVDIGIAVRVVEPGALRPRHPERAAVQVGQAAGSGSIFPPAARSRRCSFRLRTSGPRPRGSRLLGDGADAFAGELQLQLAHLLLEDRGEAGDDLLAHALGDAGDANGGQRLVEGI